MESPVQPDVGSVPQLLRAHGQPRLSPSHYTYPPPTSGSFPLDQAIDMNMNDGIATSLHVATSATAAGHEENNVPNPGTAQLDNASTAQDISAAQPVSSQTHSPTGPSHMIDAGDGSLSGGDPKRKRSKVSRACDECRRKKIRCDAVDEDGSIKTCANCQRAGIICGYNRIPMKRGPSKGYIKELSERVQQVESQMALSGTQGFRQSLDGVSNMYTDPIYSPDDHLSLKRNFSFSDPRNPFSNSEYSRDRIPSAGGWITSSPSDPSARPRDHGSIAIAPDQPLPFAPKTVLSKPFWTVHSEGQPPAKRLKPNHDLSGTSVIGHGLLANYYDVIHPKLPILPDADSAISIMTTASSIAQDAFRVTILRLRSPRDPNADTSPSSASPSEFKTRKRLNDFLWDMAREPPDLRSREDNLLYLWIFLLLAVEAESDLMKLRDISLSKSVAIKQAVDLGWHCLRSESRHGTKPDGQADNLPYQQHVTRAWYCTGILARLHALAVGSVNPIPPSQDASMPSPNFVLSPTPAYLVLATMNLSTVINLVQNPLSVSPLGKQLEQLHRQNVRFQVSALLAAAQPSQQSELLPELVLHFFDLLLSRFSTLFNPLDILASALKLTDILQKHSTALSSSSDHYRYDPLSMHLFVLTTITLLEYLQEDSSALESSRAALTAVNSMRSMLEQISERAAQEQQQLGITSESSNTDNADSRTLSSASPIHWADALIRMIDQRRSAVAEMSNGTGVGEGSGNDDGGGGEKSDSMLTHAVDFSRLLRYGYLNVLADSAGI